jgi:hypothetical protein
MNGPKDAFGRAFRRRRPKYGLVRERGKFGITQRRSALMRNVEAFRRTTIYLPPRMGVFGVGRIIPFDLQNLQNLVKLQDYTHRHELSNV